MEGVYFRFNVEKEGMIEIIDKGIGIDLIIFDFEFLEEIG